MPNTPAAAPAVSSTVGLKNMVIAPVKEDNETSTTYGDLQRVAGAIEARNRDGNYRLPAEIGAQFKKAKKFMRSEQSNIWVEA